MAAVASARTPYPEAARQLLRETLFGAARDELAAAGLVGDHDVRHRQPPPASAARPSTRSSAAATSSARPSSSTRANASSTVSRRRCASTSTIPAPRSAPRSRPSSAPPARTRWSASCSATTAPAACCPSSPPRACRSSSRATARLSSDDPGGLARRRPADEVAAPRRIPGPARDQLHHRPHRLRGGDRGGRAELLGPFIDEALGTGAEPRPGPQAVASVASK